MGENASNLCISILEFKYYSSVLSRTYKVNLCISILEFKWNKTIYLEWTCVLFMYFYIRKKYRRKGLKNKDLILLYNKRINKKLKGLTLVFYIS